MSGHDSLDFKQLVDAHYEGLYRFAWSLAKNPADACDLVQQTFAIYAKKGSSLRDAGKVKSWLFTTLYREFLRRNRRDQNLSFQEPEVMQDHAAAVETPVGRQVDGQAALRALAHLPEKFRAPLTLFYLQDLSYKEIATILDIPIGTVMSRLSRGKEQLKDALTASNVHEAEA